jgi:tetratricopeptide (TPR) repeat protein
VRKKNSSDDNSNVQTWVKQYEPNKLKDFINLMIGLSIIFTGIFLFGHSIYKIFIYTEPTMLINKNINDENNTNELNTDKISKFEDNSSNISQSENNLPIKEEILFDSDSTTEDFAHVNTSKHYLNIEYAKLKNSNQEFKNKSNEYKSVGFSYYKSKDDQTAVSYYEKALDLYADADLYYKYGNSLSNLSGGLFDAKESYIIALEFEYPERYKILYNLACVYSRMENEKKAYYYLVKSIEAGYHNNEYLAKDKDLLYLRSLENWDLIYSKIKDGTITTRDIY